MDSMEIFDEFLKKCTSSLLNFKKNVNSRIEKCMKTFNQKLKTVLEM